MPNQNTLKTNFLIILVSLMILFKLINSNKTTTPNAIYNAEEDKELTTYLAIALNVYNIKNIKIIIRYLEPNEIIALSSPDGVTSAITQYKEDVYCISLKKTNKQETIRLIAHEIVHVKQLYDKRIIYSDSSFNWKGKQIKIIPEYKKRPWEIEALSKEDSIAQIIANKTPF